MSEFADPPPPPAPHRSDLSTTVCPDRDVQLFDPAVVDSQMVEMVDRAPGTICNPSSAGPDPTTPGRVARIPRVRVFPRLGAVAVICPRYSPACNPGRPRPASHRFHAVTTYRVTAA